MVTSATYFGSDTFNTELSAKRRGVKIKIEGADVALRLSWLVRASRRQIGRMAGLLTRSFSAGGLPGDVPSGNVPEIHRNLQQRDCPGFAPGSLLIGVVFLRPNHLHRKITQNSVSCKNIMRGAFRFFYHSKATAAPKPLRETELS